MKEVCVALLFLLAATGCARNLREAQLTNIPLAEKPSVPATESACKAAGQFWVEQGIPGGNKSCAVKTTDSRKICTDENQCQGACLVENSLPAGSKAIGSCSEWVGTFGCYKYIQDGRVQQICAD